MKTAYEVYKVWSVPYEGDDWESVEVFESAEEAIALAKKLTDREKKEFVNYEILLVGWE